ncbi:GNAT family N-acetyltransferase [Novosphingobium sp.]|uniref:GNAT family N-acetyltransferase n=1 Tax=Novosphingobium sp. TaxID=1874826 RepID=UPI0025D860B5|nr:GNAT family N-acetyltransferase [Novosphingobium sp.]
MFIRSERLFLRPGWPEDWQEIQHQIGAEAIVRNLAQVPWPYRAEDAKVFAALPQDPRTPHFVVTLPGARGAQLIGGVGLQNSEERVELGYWIAQPHWNKGYATEAARALLRLAGTLGHKQIAAHHFVDNPASARVLAKIGFRPTGQIALRSSVARERPALAATHAVSLPIADCDNSDGTGGQSDKVARPMRRQAA